jgi:hypothetical protein
VGRIQKEAVVANSRYIRGFDRAEENNENLQSRSAGVPTKVNIRDLLNMGVHGAIAMLTRSGILTEFLSTALLDPEDGSLYSSETSGSLGIKARNTAEPAIQDTSQNPLQNRNTTGLWVTMFSERE